MNQPGDADQSKRLLLSDRDLAKATKLFIRSPPLRKEMRADCYVLTTRPLQTVGCLRCRGEDEGCAPQRRSQKRVDPGCPVGCVSNEFKPLPADRIKRPQSGGV